VGPSVLVLFHSSHSCAIIYLSKMIQYINIQSHLSRVVLLLHTVVIHTTNSGLKLSFICLHYVYTKQLDEIQNREVGQLQKVVMTDRT